MTLTVPFTIKHVFSDDSKLILLYICLQVRYMQHEDHRLVQVRPIAQGYRFQTAMQNFELKRLVNCDLLQNKIEAFKICQALELSRKPGAQCLEQFVSGPVWTRAEDAFREMNLNSVFGPCALVFAVFGWLKYATIRPVFQQNPEKFAVNYIFDASSISTDRKDDCQF